MSQPECFSVLTSLLQVLNADVIHREERRRGSILWTHVGNGGSISDRQLGHTRAEKLHKPPHYTHLSEVLRAQDERNKMRAMLDVSQVIVWFVKNDKVPL